MARYEAEVEQSKQRLFPVVEMTKEEAMQQPYEIKGKIPNTQEKISFKMIDPECVGEGQYRESMDPWYQPFKNQKPVEFAKA